MVLERDDDGLGQSGSRGGDEKWSGSGQAWKVEPTRFPAEEDVGVRERGRQG